MSQKKNRRPEERKKFKMLINELKRRYPIKQEGVKQKIKFMIWFDSQNHNPKGMWYIATTCFWTAYNDPTYGKVTDRLIKKLGINPATVIKTHKSFHYIKRNVFKSKHFIKVL